MVVHVAKLRGGHEEYVLRAIGGAEDYYVGSGEAPGRWLGGGAADLGLSGEVTPDAFRAVLTGCDPRSGEQLVKRKQAGFDITLSAPKSVSVLWGLGSREISAAVAEAQSEAVAAVIEYLESRASRVAKRVKDDVGSHLDFHPSSGFVAADFRHRTSRAGDPNLHDHVVVVNQAHGPDGWRALGHHPDIYAHAARTGGALYKAELHRLLTARLGVEWDDQGEIVGVDPDLCALFSRRRAEALAAVAERGLEPTPDALQTAVLATRSPKPAHVAGGREHVEWSGQARDYGVVPDDAAGLSARWRQEAAGAQLELDSTQIVMRSEPDEIDFEAVRQLGEKLSGPEGLTRLRSTFDRRDAIIAFAALPGVGAAEAQRLADRWLATEQVVNLGVRREGADERYTTRDLLSAEQHLLHSAGKRLDAGVGVVDEETLSAAIADRGLSAEQEQMVRVLCSSGAGVQCVVGVAGAGKTYALDAARRAWEAAGHTVLGVAPSAAAANELHRGAKVASATVARQILDTYRNGLPAGCVLIVDESGMVGSRSLCALANGVEAARGKLVLVGDHRQLPSIEAGGMFARLTDHLGAVELSEVRRQEDEQDREALAQVRHGSVDTGVRSLLGRVGRTTVAADVAGQVEAMIGDWSAARSAGHSVLLLASRRSQVEALSVAARGSRRAAGELGDDELAVRITQPDGRSAGQWQPSERRFSVGDEVLFRQNTSGKWRHLKESMSGVYNGAAGTVTALDAEAGTVTVRLDTTPDECAKWDALAAQRDVEVEAAQVEMAEWAQRRDAAETSAERATAERRRKVCEAKVERRLADRAAGLVVVPGRGKVCRPGSEIVVDGGYVAAGHLAYAYARTVHMAQGSTADVVLVDGMATTGREAAYVAMSRHRRDVRVYLTSTDEHVEPGALQERRADPLDELVRRISRSEAQRTATETLGRRRAQKELAAKPLGELASEVAQLEAELAVAARRAPAGRAVEDPVVAARAEVAAAEARAAQSPGERTAHQVWLAKSRLAQAEQRAARRPAPSSERAAGVDVAAKVARLQDLRAAVKLQSRLAVEALAAEGGGGLGPRPAQGPERAAWEQQAAAAITYTARWGVQPGQELGRDAPAEQRREAERLAEMLGRRAERQQVERERGVSA